MDYRFKHTVNVIKFPTGFAEEDRGLKGCCDCKQLVLAHPTETETWKNDLTGAYVKTADPADSVTFTMEDSTGAVITNFGTTAVFPNDTLAKGFIYDWQQILNSEGVGCFTINVNFTISGIVGGYEFGMYDLKQFSVTTARGTARIRSKFNTYYQKDLVDFTNSNFEDTVRFNGFFGNRQPKTEINNLIGVSRKIEKATRENLNEYTLQTDPVSICISRQLVDFHFLNEDECFISDHNQSNHDYLLLDKPVSFKNSSEIDYKPGSRVASIEAVFGDRALLDKNYYRQT